MALSSPPATLPEWIAEVFQHYSEKAVCVIRGRTLLYRDLERLTESFCAFLQSSCALKPGDVVAVALHSNLQWPVVVLGALKAGASVQLLDWEGTPTEWLAQLQKSKARCLVAPEHKSKVIAAFLSETETKTVVTTAAGDLLYFPRNIVMTQLRRIKSRFSGNTLLSQTDPGNSFVPFAKALDLGRNAPFQAPGETPDSIALFILAGAKPYQQRVMSHAEVLHYIRTFARALTTASEKGPGLLKESRELVVNDVNPSTDLGVILGFMTFFQIGATQILCENANDNTELAQVFLTHRVSAFLGNRVDITGVLHQPQIAKANFSSLKWSALPTDEWDQELSDRWQNLTGQRLTQLELL